MKRLPKRIKRCDLINRILKDCEDVGHTYDSLQKLVDDDLIIIYYTYQRSG